MYPPHPFLFLKFDIWKEETTFNTLRVVFQHILAAAICNNSNIKPLLSGWLSPKGERALGRRLCVQTVRVTAGYLASLMRCLKMANLKFTLLCPNGAHTDLLARCCWHLKGPEGAFVVASRRVCAVCKYSHTHMHTVCVCSVSLTRW